MPDATRSRYGFGVHFLNSRHNPPREFSLTELVSAINELQRRRQAREDAAEERGGEAESRQSSGHRDGDYDLDRELTE